MIDISKLDKAEVLAALYNASRPQGIGFLRHVSEDMTVEEARELVVESTRFDYVRGRVMKVRLDGEEFDPVKYDRDNGEGAAAAALKPLFDKIES